jgi:hypothetical protein
VPKVKIPRDDLCTIIANSKHILFRPHDNPNWIKCARCASTMHSSTAGVRHWIQGECTGIGQSNDRPIPVYDKLIQIGNHIIHHSHKIYTFKNCFYCQTCGTNVQVKMKKLKDPCTNRRTKAGQDFLDHINNTGNIKTTRNRSTFDECLDNIQNNINTISQNQAQEEVNIPSSPDINNPEDPSEDCQSPLGPPGLSDSD